LGISRYFGEVDVKGIYFVPYEKKPDSLAAALELLDPEVLNLLVFHIGRDTPELAALKDLNPGGLAEMSKHRHQELEALLSPAFRVALDSLNIRTITYRALIDRLGLEAMLRPEEKSY
jgi:hypothetical protein